MYAASAFATLETMSRGYPTALRSLAKAAQQPAAEAGRDPPRKYRKTSERNSSLSCLVLQLELPDLPYHLIVDDGLISCQARSVVGAQWFLAEHRPSVTFEESCALRRI